MLYINALKLIDLCVKNNVLKEMKGKIFIYRSGTSENEPGWHLTEKDIVTKELMINKDGQRILISTLNKKNINFTPTDYC